MQRCGHPAALCIVVSSAGLCCHAPIQTSWRKIERSNRLLAQVLQCHNARTRGLPSPAALLGTISQPAAPGSSRLKHEANGDWGLCEVQQIHRLAVRNVIFLQNSSKAARSPRKGCPAPNAVLSPRPVDTEPSTGISHDWYIRVPLSCACLWRRRLHRRASPTRADASGAAAAAAVRTIFCSVCLGCLALLRKQAHRIRLLLLRQLGGVWYRPGDIWRHCRYRRAWNASCTARHATHSWQCTSLIN